LAWPGPPQLMSRLPDWSNTGTGGAATQHLAVGGFCAAARSRSLSVEGRWTAQMGLSGNLLLGQSITGF
jgi:hypothetical protein